MCLCFRVAIQHDPVGDTEERKRRKEELGVLCPDRSPYIKAIAGRGR